jgi:hypothetical protein
MRTIKNNWLLAAAVSAALSGYAGVSMAADAPALLELTTAMDTVSNKAGAPSTKIKLWVIDANGNITSNDVDHTVNLGSSDTAVIGNTTLTFPAGVSYIEKTVGISGADVPVAGLGAANLSAAFAETGSAGVATSVMLPIKVVADFMKASNTMTSAVVAGQAVDAFKVTNSADAALADNPITVIHYDIGSNYPAAEVIGGIASGLTPDTAGLGGFKGSFPTTDATGKLNLVFEVASANPTTTGEYYILKDPMGKLADVRVDNFGSDNQADIVPAAASDVLYLENGMVLNSFNVAANGSGAGFAGDLPALTTVDAYGNVITGTDISDANVTISSPAGGTLANGVVSYSNLESDDMVLSFANPAGATLGLKAVAAGTQPVMSGDNCLSITMAGTVESTTFAAYPAGAKITGGVSTALTSVAQQDISIDANDAVDVKFNVTADSAATGNYGMVFIYRPPVPNAPTFAITAQAAASGSGIGALDFWDFNTATIPAYNSTVVPAPNAINLVSNFEFGLDLTGMWFIAPGYTSGDAYVTCAASIDVQ